MSYPTAADISAYFEAIATSLKDIANSGAGNHFTKVTSFRAMEGFLAERLNLKGYQLVYMDYLRGKFIDNKSDNILNQRFYTFFVLKNAPDSLYDGKGDAAINDCLAVSRKIISKMRNDRRNYANLMERVDVGSISFEQVGPVGQGWYGVNVSFFMIDNPGDIIYDATDWIS